METEFSNIAVLIDAENVSASYLKKIFERIAAYGHISVKRIYADWTDSKLNSWKELIHEHSLVTIQQFSNIQAKNVSDFTLVIDAMDLLHEGIFDCFCIVSSDSDFTRLVQRIKEKGKNVIGIGEKKAVKAFVKACNGFIYLDDEPLKKEIIAETNKDESRNETLDDLMNTAIDKLSNQDGWVQMNKIIPYLKQMNPAFSLEEHGIKRLSNYFKDNKEYELQKGNTSVRKK